MDEPDKLRALSCHRIDSQDFLKVLKKTINEEEYRNQVISIGEKFLEDYLEYPGNSSNKIASYLFHVNQEKSNS